MRFIGNKDSIITDIKQLLIDKKLDCSNLSLFDAFCGTGAVADSLKDMFSLIINDNLSWATTYSRGKICSSSCLFEKLGFNPFKYLNETKNTVYGFMYNNYSYGGSNRMYFTAENAARIDFFRQQIQDWHDNILISDNEYCYLLASLIESVSSVSNTAGVYGAFLKKWDSRALKPIQFIAVDASEKTCKSLVSYSDKIEDIISYVDCDILYLDPPYTQNQYGTQYHLLETLIKNDNPTISKITGSRPTAPMRSDWSKKHCANILLDNVLAHTKARYIILSYNNDGLMSKAFIEASMKRYGKLETFECRKIKYKKYQNWKSQNDKEHFEYLFFIEKKDTTDIKYESPLNYIGNKSKIIEDIKRNLPSKFSTFVDAFGGGFNVGINIITQNIVYNDYNYIVKELIESFKNFSTLDYLSTVYKYIDKFGLKKSEAEGYYNARLYYNSIPESKRDPRLLFAIIMYGYQQQIRFNSNHDFNNPIGMRWFNDFVLEKMISFSRRIRECDCTFFSVSYSDLLEHVNNCDCFYYFDPPYELTTGSYNDGKRGFYGWSKASEKQLFCFLNTLNAKGNYFMLSYVLEHKGKENNELLKWINDNHYKVICLGDIIGISGSRRKEVLIVNYENI